MFIINYPKNVLLISTNITSGIPDKKPQHFNFSSKCAFLTDQALLALCLVLILGTFHVHLSHSKLGYCTERYYAEGITIISLRR